MGNDGCVYMVHLKGHRVLKYDIKYDTTKLVGDAFGSGTSKQLTSTLAEDGCIYCIPHCASHILRIDPVQQIAENGNTNFHHELNKTATLDDIKPLPHFHPSATCQE